jgi:prolipoprotein diacylglyceryltransferase
VIAKLLALMGLLCFALWIVAKRMLWPPTAAFGFLLCMAVALYAAVRLSNERTRRDTTNSARR